MPQRLVLASTSARRRELLARLGVRFTCVASGVDEEAVRIRPARALAMALAGRKARVVARRHPDAVVLAADTVVVLRGKVLGKPKDAAEAASMLGALRARAHQVITGVCVVAPGRAGVCRYVASKVRMRAYTTVESLDYICRGEPFDKAGGYGIQDARFAPVAKLDGCYYNVMGLPLGLTTSMLRDAGLSTKALSGRVRCPCCRQSPTHKRSSARRLSLRGR
ncbi:MAG: Maf family protein [Elusimicrobiota bacterium]